MRRDTLEAFLRGCGGRYLVGPDGAHWEYQGRRSGQLVFRYRWPFKLDNVKVLDMGGGFYAIVHADHVPTDFAGGLSEEGKRAWSKIP